MTHLLAVLERFRQVVAAVLHLPLAAVGLDAVRRTPRAQYVLTVRCSAADFEATLHRLGTGSTL